MRTKHFSDNEVIQIGCFNTSGVWTDDAIIKCLFYYYICKTQASFHLFKKKQSWSLVYHQKVSLTSSCANGIFHVNLTFIRFNKMQLLSLPNIKMESYLDWTSLMSHSISIILLYSRKCFLVWLRSCTNEKTASLIIQFRSFCLRKWYIAIKLHVDRHRMFSFNVYAQ